MYIVKDKNGKPFKWNKKGKNKECWVKTKECVTKKCFEPEDCGTTDPKTQQKTIIGMCKTYSDGMCPLGYSRDDNLPINYRGVKRNI